MVEESDNEELRDPTPDGLLPETLTTRGRDQIHSTLPSHGSGVLAESDPQRIGRFVVLGRLGAGGMGIVYSAYDELLDRRLAIKLVRGDRSDSIAQARMHREAQALARLSHPNVVQVYEVGEFAGQLFLAMEFVSGQTLRGWLADHRELSTPADPGPILEHCLAAGEGLVAAHAVGLIHRDFKPDNVLVGDDGRVRVLDFGLAAAAETPPVETPPAEGSTEKRSEPRSRSDAFGAPLTNNGAVLGTPVYMPPEQIVGSVLDARADVFSFAVTLHESLFGVRPFAGDQLIELFRNIHAGARVPLDEPPARSLEWLVPLIDRGLAPDPDDRWPTMAEFLEALRDNPELRRRQRRNRRRGAVAAVFGGVALTAALVVPGRVVAQRCDDAAAAIDRLWGPPARATVAAAFARSDSPHAGPTWERLNERLLGWSDGWRSARVEACMDGDDASLAAARMSCLDHQLWRFEGLRSALVAGRAATINRSISAAAGLPLPIRCEELLSLQRLSGDEAPDAVAPEVLAIDRRLGLIRGLVSVGEIEEVSALIGPILGELEGLDAPRLVAEARYLEGVVLRKTGDFEAAAAAVADAYFRAGAVGDERLAAEAAIIELAILGVDLNREDAVDGWTSSARMMLERGRLADGDLGAMLQMVRGVLLRQSGEYNAALASYEDAVAILTRELGPRHPEIAKLRLNMANAYAQLGKDDLALAQAQLGLEIFLETYGPQHPDVANFYVSLGTFLIAGGEVEEGIEVHRSALEIDEVTYGPDHPAVGVDIFNLGYDLAEFGDVEGAVGYYERAAAIFEKALPPDHPMIASLLTAQGRAVALLGEPERGLELLQRAEKIRIGGDRGELAVTRFFMAELLWSRPQERRRAHAMASESRTIFASEDFWDEPQLAQVDLWLREHPLPEGPEESTRAPGVEPE